MEAKFLASVFSLLSIFLAVYAQSEPTLVPIYHVPEQKMQIFTIGYPLVFSCNGTLRGAIPLRWEKNGTDVTQVKSLEKRYHINHIKGELTIYNTNTNDDGPYSCVTNNQNADFYAVGAIDIRVPTNIQLAEGEKLTIPCKVEGTDPKVYWVIQTGTKHTISSSNDRYILKADENHIENAILEIEKVKGSDRGEYKCIAFNAASKYHKYHEANDVAYVRVSKSSRNCALSIYFLLLLSTVLTFSSLRKY